MAIAALIWSGGASAQTKSFDIPSEEAVNAIPAFAAQAGLQVIAPGDVLRGIRTPPVRGSLDVHAALSQLLAGTQLEIGSDDGKTILLRVRQKNADAAPEEKAASEGIETVVVTAEKREQNIQDVPASVNVLTGADLSAMHAVSLQDMAGYIPGLTVEPGGGAGFETIVLDGIAPTGTTAVTRVYIDETPLGSSSGAAASTGLTPDLMPYDINCVEVLDGPQGTLYGANAVGGVIKYVLTRPDLSGYSAEFGADVLAIANGGGEGEQVRAAVNIPLIDDELGLRVSLYQGFTPGYINDVETGWKHDNALHNDGGRIALLWEPTSKLSIQATALVQETLQVNPDLIQYNPTTHQPFAGGGVLSNVFYLPQNGDIRLQLYDVTAKWDFDWANLTSSSSFQSFRSVYHDDLTAEFQPLIALLFGVPNTKSEVSDNPEVQKFTEELRLASPAQNTFEWMIGGYFTNEKTTQVQNIFTVPFSAVGQLEFAGIYATYNEYAAFGDLTWHITDRLDLGGGLRYSYNDQHYVEPAGGLLLGTGTGVPAQTNIASSNQGVATWNANSSYHFDEHDMVYVRIATGFLPGAPNPLAPGVSNAPTSYSASTLIDYEGGIKSSWLDGKALANLSVYDIEWNNMQVPDFLPACSCVVTTNAGTARSVGTSLNTSYSPIEGLRLGANLVYTDAVVTAPIPLLGTVTGARLPFVPLWAWSLTADYTAPLDDRWRLVSGIGYRYGGRSWSTVQGEGGGYPDPAPAYNQIDLHVGVTDGSWKVTLYGKNVTNDLYLRDEGIGRSAFGTPTAFQAIIAQPRTIGISLDKSF